MSIIAITPPSPPPPGAGHSLGATVPQYSGNFSHSRHERFAEQRAKSDMTMTGMLPPSKVLKEGPTSCGHPA